MLFAHLGTTSYAIDQGSLSGIRGDQDRQGLSMTVVMMVQEKKGLVRWAC